MRITTALAGVSLVFGLAGCGITKESDGVTVRCSNRHANVNHASSHLDQRPDTIKLCTGFMLTLELHPPLPDNTAHTRQPGTGNDWLDQDNVGAFIYLTPPEGTSVGEIKYDLIVDGVGMLDPRIVVQ